MLKFDAYEIPSRNQRPASEIPRPGGGLTVTYLYTHGGDHHNNKTRLQAIALLTGGLAIGLQTPGTGRIYIDRATRRALQPANIHDLANDYAGEVDTLLQGEGRTTNVLVADSGRVLLGASMQLSKHRPFTHAVYRDGTNLVAPETVREGYHRLTHQKPAQFTHYTEEKSWLHRLQDRRSFIRGLAEVATQGKLLTSTAGTETMVWLAADPTTPVLHFTFEDGICGPVEAQRAYAEKLMETRADAWGEAGRELFVAAVLPGAHGDLANPLLLDDHIQQVQRLSSARP